MIGFAVTFYIRSQTIKKVVNIRINLAKDTLAYVLLFVMAMVVSLEIPGAYFIGIAAYIVIIALYFRDIEKMTKKTAGVLKKIISRREAK